MKGRDQRVVFAGVLDYITVTSCGLSIVLKEFTHVQLSGENLRRGAAVVPRSNYTRHNLPVCLHQRRGAADQNRSGDGETNPFRWTV